MMRVAVMAIACWLACACIETSSRDDNHGCESNEGYGFLPGCNREEGVCSYFATCRPDLEFEFCGCDGVTFIDNCTMPRHPYAYKGPCIEGIGDNTPPCGSDGECTLDEMCAFGPGCVDPERYCVVDTCADAIAIYYCGCNGETFAIGCIGADRPIANVGRCDDSSTDDVVDPVDVEPSDVPGG